MCGFSAAVFGLFFGSVFSCEDLIPALEKLRDTLLPKLMSGKVRVENEN